MVESAKDGKYSRLFTDDDLDMCVGFGKLDDVDGKSSCIEEGDEAKPEVKSLSQE